MRALLKKSSITSNSSVNDVVQEAQEILRKSGRTDYRRNVRAERISKDDPNIKFILGKR